MSNPFKKLFKGKKGREEDEQRSFSDVFSDQSSSTASTTSSNTDIGEDGLELGLYLSVHETNGLIDDISSGVYRSVTIQNVKVRNLAGLLNAVAVCQSLESLTLENTAYSKQEYQALTAVIQKGSVKYLTLDGSGLDEKQQEGLVSSIKKSKTLELAYLDKCIDGIQQSADNAIENLLEKRQVDSSAKYRI